MKVFVAQINPTVGDIEGNTRLILAAIEEGKRAKADVVLTPELALTGYPPEDFLLLPHFIDAAIKALEAIATKAIGIAAVVGTVRRNPIEGEKHLLNSAAILDKGGIQGYHDKMLLPTYDVFDERRFFEPGAHIGLWFLAGTKVGITICEDLWQHSELLRETRYMRDPVTELAKLSPDVVLNLSASPYCTGKVSDRIVTISKAAQAMHCPLILCNQVGGNDSLIFDGHSIGVDAAGSLKHIAKGFSSDTFIIDTKRFPPTTVSYSDPGIEDVFKALVLGVRDYFHKSGCSKACLGLSGGIDSAVVACIATEALGKENVLGVLMPSRYSTAESSNDAQALAQALGTNTKVISIEGPFQEYLNLLTSHFEGRTPDSTEENLQARVRGMILMALSNKLGYLVLSTGNKSELAMGYSTLYGDMCGGLAVISDVTKQQVYALAHWINRNNKIIPQNTIVRAPSAELRPNQKDTDSLPDYAIVDTVLDAYIERHKSPEQIAANNELPIALVQSLVKKIHANEYKRRQSPPGLRVTEKAFSTGRRFPIVQRYT